MNFTRTRDTFVMAILLNRALFEFCSLCDALPIRHLQTLILANTSNDPAAIPQGDIHSHQ
jgi:hypothetical protein